MRLGDAVACALTFDEKDKISGLAGEWTFTASSGAKVNVPDSEYLHFGWWIDRPTKAASDGNYSYEFPDLRGRYGGLHRI